MKFTAHVRLASAPAAILDVIIDGNRVNGSDKDAINDCIHKKLVRQHGAKKAANFQIVNASKLYDDMDFNEICNKTYV